MNKVTVVSAIAVLCALITPTLLFAEDDSQVKGGFFQEGTAQDDFFSKPAAKEAATQKESTPSSEPVVDSSAHEVRQSDAVSDRAKEFQKKYPKSKNTQVDVVRRALEAAKAAREAAAANKRIPIKATTQGQSRFKKKPKQPIVTIKKPQAVTLPKDSDPAAWTVPNEDSNNRSVGSLFATEEGGESPFKVTLVLSALPEVHALRMLDRVKMLHKNKMAHVEEIIIVGLEQRKPPKININEIESLEPTDEDVKRAYQKLHPSTIEKFKDGIRPKSEELKPYLHSPREFKAIDGMSEKITEQVLDKAKLRIEKSLRELNFQSTGGGLAEKILAREGIQTSPSWIVRYGGQEHLFEGNLSPEDFLDEKSFPLASTNTGERIVHKGPSMISFPKGADREPKMSKEMLTAKGFEKLKKGREKGRYKFKLRANYFRLNEPKPAKKQVKEGEIFLKKLPNCKSPGRRRVEVPYVSNMHMKLDVTYYNKADEEQLQRASALKRFSVPYKGGKKYSLADPNIYWSNMANSLKVRCLPTRYHAVQSGSKSYIEHLEGERAW
jgi:hypothetical protein